MQPIGAVRKSPRRAAAFTRSRLDAMEPWNCDSRNNAHPARIAIRAGDLVWRTHDPELERAARPFTNAITPVRLQVLDVNVWAAEGEPLRTEWTIAEHPEKAIAVMSSEPLGRAQNRAVSIESLREQLGRLGNTPYRLGELDLEIRGAPFVPISVLNQLRRDAVAKLQELQTSGGDVVVRDSLSVLQSTAVEPLGTDVKAGSPQLHLLIRTPDQLDAALEARPASITLDYLDLYGLRPSIQRVKDSGHRRASGQSARFEARGGADFEFPGEFELPDSGPRISACFRLSPARAPKILWVILV